jgi:hypothetical protein
MVGGYGCMYGRNTVEMKSRLEIQINELYWNRDQGSHFDLLPFNQLQTLTPVRFTSFLLPEIEEEEQNMQRSCRSKGKKDRLLMGGQPTDTLDGSRIQVRCVCMHVWNYLRCLCTPRVNTSEGAIRILVPTFESSMQLPGMLLLHHSKKNDLCTFMRH